MSNREFKYLVSMIISLFVFITIDCIITTCYLFNHESEIEDIKDRMEYIELNKVEYEINKTIDFIENIFCSDDPILNYLDEECKKYNLDIYQMIGLIYVESKFNSKAISYKGIDYGYGLMQVSSICLKDYNLWNGTSFTQDDLGNPYTNITIGLWIYNQNKRYMKNEYDDDSLLSAYNIGARMTKEKGLNYTYINKVKKAIDEIDVNNIVIN